MKIKLFCLVFIAYFGFVQAQVSNEIYDKIPVSHQNHPELKNSKHQTQHQESKYELVHLRTQYSKTFLNTNQTQTTIQSSVPLHYKDESDFWLSVDYKITDSKESLSYPSHQPIVKYDKKTQDLSLFNSNEQIKFLKNVDVTFVNNQNQVVKKMF